MMAALLTDAQKDICLELQKKSSKDSPRAAALLALNQGATQSQAAEKSGLSLGQVRYCVRRFRSVGMAMFELSKPDGDSGNGSVSDVVIVPEKNNKKDKKDKKGKKKKSKNKSENDKKEIKKPKQKNKKKDKKIKKADKKNKGKKKKK